MITGTRKLLPVLFLATALTCPVAALGAPTPRQVIQEGAEKVRTILQKKTKSGSTQQVRQKAELKKIVDHFLDYHELSRRSLGPHWKDRSPEEQKEFVQLLRDLIEESYTRPISNNIDFSMEYEEEEIDDDGIKASVITVASARDAKGKTVSEDLTFRLFLRNKKWMIYDVLFGDLSMVENYRGEFNRKIKKEGYTALLGIMREKLQEIKSGKAGAQKQPKL